MYTCNLEGVSKPLENVELNNPGLKAGVTPNLMKARFVVLGGGISGLSLGWFLKRRFGSRIDLKILEKSGRVGGWIETSREGGFLFELGPRSCPAIGCGRDTLDLIEQLNLRDQIIVADSHRRGTYLWIKNRLVKVPRGPFSLLTSPFVKDAILGSLRDFIAPPCRDEDESIYSFVLRRFGERIAEYLVDPLAKGIFGGDIRKLSVKACFPSLYQYERGYGSVIKGILAKKKKQKILSKYVHNTPQKDQIFSLKGGMETLIHELADRLEEHLLLSTTIKGITCSPQCVTVELEEGGVLEADHIFSTIPQEALAPFFAKRDPGLKLLLSEMTYASLAVVGLGYHRKILDKEGFGYLIPTKEKEDVLGMVWDSSVFPQQNQRKDETRLTAMIGGVHMSHFDECSESDFLNIALEAVSKHLGHTHQPQGSVVKIARRAIPQYHVGHFARVQEVEAILSSIFPRMTVHGSSFHGVSVGENIARSKRIAEEMQV